MPKTETAAQAKRILGNITVPSTKLVWKEKEITQSAL